MNKPVAFLAAAWLALAVPASAAEAPAPDAAGSHVALPRDVSPERYEIRIAPDAERLSFTGHARIAVVVRQPTDRIVLNAADLSLQHVSLSGIAETPRVALDPEQQTAAFVFSRPLAPGRYQLDIDYSGKIYQQASGLFALDTEVAGRRVRDLFTQFENSDARRFAPTWDEPGAKAVFQLTVEAPAGEMAVSNMPVARTEPLPGGGQAITFADTPKMSSYLLFLAVGDFERIHRQVGATDIGVIVSRGEAAKGRFALDAASELLGYYNDYFGVPFPLPKLDLISGPGQSQFFGAMENWGAIFFFDRDLLIEPTSSPAERQNVYVTVAHEMAHQWFGDLVTMAWWDDLWLNEGFASWMENKATDHFHPDWKMTLQAMESRDHAMRTDAASGTHPVITPIHDVFAAADAFDTITYQKGAAVIRMLEGYMGEDAFRTGIRAYIARNAYGATTTDQLWSELERVSPKPIAQIAHDFTLQAGVPLIQAAQARRSLKLGQSRFATVGSPTTGSWIVPVRVAGLAGGDAQTELVSRARPQLASWPAGTPAVVNAGQDGYFRTLYAPELWSRLEPHFLELAPADQLGLLFDARALGDTGLEPVGDFLALARLAARAEEPVVLSNLAGELALISEAYPDGQGEAYRAYARACLSPILARVGWDARPGEGPNVPGLRTDLIEALGDLGDPAATAEARRRFEAAQADPAGLTGALKNAVQAVAARHADAQVWDQLHALARAAHTTTERNRLYRLLGAPEDAALANRALALALSGEPPPTTAPSIIASVAALHPDAAFDFAIAHRREVEALLEPTSRTIFFTGLARFSDAPSMLGKLDAFAATIPASSRGEVVKAQSEVRRRRLFIEQRLPEIDHWLAQHPA
jgi:aminopeptidase N